MIATDLLDSTFAGPSLQTAADRAAEWIREHWKSTPLVGMVLGTGSGSIAEALIAEARFPYDDLPGFARSTAIGHVGQLICGHWDDVPMVAMQGRCHLYEGYPPGRLALPIHVMARLGIERLLVSNAAGGVNPQFAVGDLMLIDSHIDLFFRFAPGSLPIERPGCVGELYDRQLLEAGSAAARRLGIRAHRGVYVGLLGPNYETRAEYRMVRRIGGDAVGMSTVPEIVAAWQCGVPVLAVSVITNVARPDCLEKTSGHEVVAAGRRAADDLRRLFAAVLRCC